MPKNAVERLQKIENDLKTVISIYEVSNKCKNCQSQKQDVGSQLPPQINTQENLRVEEPSKFNFSYNKAIIAQPSQDVYSTESVQGTDHRKVEKSSPLSVSTLSTICEVSYVKTKGSRNREKPDTDTHVINNFSNSKCKKGKENRKLIAGKSRLVSSKEYPDWLIHTTSNWFGPVKENCNRKECFPSSPNVIDENMQKTEEEKGLNKISDKDFSDAKEIKCKELVKRESIDKKVKVQPFHGHNNQKTQKGVEDRELYTNELSKMIERSNEKLEKMKISKELALDIAKHLKEKYEEIQQSKRELMESLVQVQEDNENVRKELHDAQIKIEELRKSKNMKIEEEVKTKEIMEENAKKLTAKICKLEKELIERERKIKKFQTARITEIKTEENQARDIQRLFDEKCQLLTTNDELVILLTDSHLEKQLLEQKIHQLVEEVQMQKQHLKKKAETLKETNAELESIRQSSTYLENQVKILRKNVENFEEAQKNFTKRNEEYEQEKKINQEVINKLQDENIKLKTELDNEKDALLIKTKIIDDQLVTIKQLKEKLEDEKKRKESLERILNTERTEKFELEEALEHLKWRKEELKKKIKDLESDLQSAPQVAEDLQKTQTILYELENQVYSKQKEWELQFQSLIREKEQACNIAEYATRKLIQTSSEFQKQSEAHKRLCRILNENLTEK